VIRSGEPVFIMVRASSGMREEKIFHAPVIDGASDDVVFFGNIQYIPVFYFSEE